MLVIGHRGASHDFPENTLEAFHGAREMGADWVELDVRATIDGHLAIHHDAHLGGGRAIAETEWSEMADRVPDLAAALNACHPMGVNVEIKNSPGEPGYDRSGLLVDAVLEVIAACDPPLDVLISCFDAATLDQVRTKNPAMATGYLVLDVDQPLDAVERAISGGHQAVNPWDPTVTQDVVDRCHASGIAVNVWTVDDPERIRELASWGVDAVITNRPAVAVSVLASL